MYYVQTINKFLREGIMNKIKIYLFCKDKLIEWEIKHSSCKSVEFLLDKNLTLFSKDYSVVFDYDGENYKLSSNEDFEISFKGEVLDFKNISDSDVLLCNFLRENSKLILFVQLEENINSVFYKFPLSDVKKLTIGCGDDNDIIYKNKNVLNKHILMSFDGKPNVKAVNSAAGCYVNQVRFLDRDLKFGDVVFLYGLKCVYLDDYIALNDPNKNVYCQLPIIKSQNLNKLSPRSFNVFDKRVLNTDKIFLDSDEENRILINPPKFNLKFGSSFLYFISGLLGIICLSLSILGLISYTMMFIYLAGVSGVLAVIVGAGAFLINSSRNSKILKKYFDYLDEKDKEIALIKHDKVRDLNQKYPKTLDCYKMVVEFGKRLWERNSQDKNFLSLLLSQGKLHFDNLKIDSEYSTNVNEDHELYQKYSQIVKDSNVISKAPITIPLREVCRFAIVGDMDLLYKTLKSFVVQMASLHSPSDLKLSFMYSKSHEKNISFVRELPHVYSDKKDFRYLATDEEEFANLIYDIKNIVIEREMALSFNENQKFETSYCVFVFYDENDMLKSFLEFMGNVDKRINVSVVLITTDNKFVPNSFKYILQVDSSEQILFRVSGDGQIRKLSLQHDYVEAENLMDMDLFVSVLGRMKLSYSINENEKIDSRTIFDLYGCSSADDIMILNRWNRNKLITTNFIPIGVQENGNSFSINVHSKRNGPNGIILGESGSGKSEFIRTFIMSYSISFSPSEINFLVLKSEYNSKLNSLIDLPHVLEILDKENVSERNRITLLIKNEILRRKNLFSYMKVSDINSYSNVRDNYLDAPIIQHLVLVIDDVSEKDFDFVKELSEISYSMSEVGIHLIVSSNDVEFFSQKIFDITSKFDFKVCFRMKNSDDMFKLIGSGEVLNPSTPGIFNVSFSHSEIFKNVELTFINVIRFLENEYECLDVVNSCGLITKKVSRANYIENGIDEQDSIIKAVIESTGKFEFEVMDIFNSSLRYLSLQELAGYQSKFNGFMWCNNTKECSAIVGIIDDPKYQVQRFLEVDFKNKGNLFIYGSHGTGKSTLINTLIYSLCCEYKSENLNIYIVDLNTRNTDCFKYAPHVKDIVYSKEEVNSLFKKVLDEFELRKKIFGNLDISSVENYKLRTDDVLPYVILVIDSIQDIFDNVWNYTNFIKMLARDGKSYGIYVCVSSSEYSQDEIKLSEYFDNKFVLKLTDESVYEKLLGENCKINSKFKGRGLVRYEDSQGSRILEFQVAYPMNCENEVDLNNKMRSLFMQMDEINNKVYGSLDMANALEED